MSEPRRAPRSREVWVDENSMDPAESRPYITVERGTIFPIRARLTEIMPDEPFQPGDRVLYLDKHPYVVIACWYWPEEQHWEVAVVSEKAGLIVRCADLLTLIPPVLPTERP